eukprot:CAMPEP_0204342744 /NCGR_PEP_ID=MMETSP0469-20131031/24368_1 /ASSEMBLY_ACC=CAM_ASM_000384 /TAXON_ID=2969 /ORGANISM="Oxyrrhis marina" /LENGTH=236 /DNA_ID=CAMNT_0051327719 /DNA_START=41 /DNA_END=748 /DNA_ORIENTATION=-
MDINSTVVFNDIMSGKEATPVLLSALYECTAISKIWPTKEGGQFQWDADHGVKIKQGMTFKKLAKSLFPQKKQYNEFWTLDNCAMLIQRMQEDFGARLVWGDNVEMPGAEDFRRLFCTFESKLVRTVRKGIVRSWFELYRKYRKEHLIMLNTFGVECRRLILETVKREDKVTLWTVNYQQWEPFDQERFKEQYDISNTADADDEDMPQYQDPADAPSQPQPVVIDEIPADIATAVP